MPVLTLEEKGIIIGHLEAGISITAVAKKFKRRWHTIKDVKEKYTATGSLKRKTGGGRKKVTNEEQATAIIAAHEANPFKTAVETAKERQVSRWTVGRVLKSAGIRARIPAKKQRLTDNHKEARLAWCHRHLQWTVVDDWSSVLFTDESSFQVNASERRNIVYRKDNERYNPDNIVEFTNKGYGNVMVWGGIIDGRKTALVRINGRLTKDNYCEDILTNHVIPLCRQGRAVFMHDNAPPHKAHVTTHFLDNHDVNVMQWPACSPDINPIEHVWSCLKRKLRQRETCRNSDHLFETLCELWAELTPDFIRSLTHSMRRRLNMVMEANGGHTKY